jgi:hypothetical protein
VVGVTILPGVTITMSAKSSAVSPIVFAKLFPQPFGKPGTGGKPK